MSPEESDSDRTLIKPPGSGERPADRTVAFDSTQVYASPAPASPAAAADMGNGLPIGTRLGEFELTQLVGEGGFGIVYMATDHSLQRRVALKEYMPSSLAARSGVSQVQVKSERYRETFEAGRKSFINEARLLAQFDHPSLVKVYRFWEANGTAYLVMPFYEGKNLRDTLRSTPVTPDEPWLRTLLHPLTEALLVIHAEQCYHRDIAPDNVMMLAGSNRPLLLDFGAARRVIGDMTQALTVILKPGYAPVEQYAEIPGMKQGPWTDVYALAAVVHYAITGRTPPPSVGRLLNDTYQPLTQVAAGRYSEGFLAAVDRALAVRPEQRTQTIDQLRVEMGLDGMAPAIRTQMTMAQPPAPAPAGPGAITQLMGTLPPTAVVPPPQARPAAPAPGAKPAAAAAEPGHTDVKGGKGALVGVGIGVLVLAGVGFGAWRLMATPSPAPEPAAVTAPAAPATVALAPAGSPVPAAATPAAPAPAPVLPPVAPPPPARFDPDRELDRIAQAQTASFGLRAEALKTDLSIAKKDEIRFRVTSDREGFLYVIGYGSDGSLGLLVPNAKSPNVRLAKGQTWSFPTKDGFYLPASEPLGSTRLLVMVSPNKRNFDALKPKSADLVKLFPTGDEATALAAQFKGAGSILAGQPQCAPGGDCADEYGAVLMKFETLR